MVQKNNSNQIVLNNLSLAWLVKEITPIIEGSIIRKVQELENNWIKFKLQTRQGTKDIVISENAFFLSEYSLPAKFSTSGFGAFLKKFLLNKKILSVEQKNFDRVLVFGFDDYDLIIELFAKGNLILIDKNMKIVRAMRKEEWKDRSLMKDQLYKFPASSISPILISSTELRTNGNPKAFSHLVKSINIAPEVLEQVFFEESIDLESKLDDISNLSFTSIVNSIKSFYLLKDKHYKPCVFSSCVLSFPFNKFSSNEQDFVFFDSLNLCVNELLAKSIFSKQQKEDLTKSEKRKKELDFSVEQQFKAKEKFESLAEESFKVPELLYNNYLIINKLFEELKIKQFSSDLEKTKKEIMYKYPFVVELDFKRKNVEIDSDKLVA